ERHKPEHNRGSCKHDRSTGLQWRVAAGRKRLLDSREPNRAVACARHADDRKGDTEHLERPAMDVRDARDDLADARSNRERRQACAEPREIRPLVSEPRAPGRVLHHRYAAIRAGASSAQMRKPPVNALSLPPSTTPSGSSSRSFAFPPPSTT